jgi:phosphate starvation-inducible protein PhoH and related proteins
MAKRTSRVNGNGNGNGHFTDTFLLDELKPKVPIISFTEKKVKIKCKNEKQKQFINMIDDYQITLCSGPAGCGKSHLSIMKALEFIQRDDNKYKKIFIITPTVEATKNSVGFLPGDFTSKVSLFMNSVYRLFDKIVGKEYSDRLVKNGLVEVLGLGYIRGENLDDCILLVEEAQNISKKEMLTILTRIGYNCKMIISGDLMQIDNFRNIEESGLYHAMQKLQNIDDIGIFEFTNDDIVRNNIISKILEKY